MYKVLGRRAALGVCAAMLLALVLVLRMGVGAAINASAIALGDSVRLPILMYHRVYDSQARQGKYLITPQTFEADLLYLSENGYTAISGDQLVAYVEQGAPLPDKPVMITFDDGFRDNLIYAVPLLEKYDMCGIISIVGSYTELYSGSDDHNPAYAYLSYDDICEAAASGYIEIGNHTYDMHNHGDRYGAMRKRGESQKTYQAALYDDLQKLQQAIFDYCGFEPIIFAYPFGQVDKASHEVIKSLGFKMSLGCGERVNIITNDKDCLYNLGRFNRPAGINTEEFMKRIE